MGIRREQPGAAKAAAAAGTIVGRAKRAEEDRARAEREQARAAAEAMQRQARQDEMKWALQKRQDDWTRALAKERRQEDYRLLAEDRAMERGLVAADYTAQKALERIEFSKDLDHQYKTQERQRKIGVIDAGEAALDKVIERGEHTEDEFAIQVKREEYRQQRIALETGFPYRPMSAQDKLMLRLQGPTGGAVDPGVGGVGPPLPTDELTVKHMEAIAAVGKTYLRRKDTGELVEVPIDRAKDAVATGRFMFPNVSGVPSGLLKKTGPDIVRQETAMPQRGSFTF